jgi:hypothetical protein
VLAPARAVHESCGASRSEGLTFNLSVGQQQFGVLAVEGQTLNAQSLLLVYDVLLRLEYSKIGTGVCNEHCNRTRRQ